MSDRFVLTMSKRRCLVRSPLVRMFCEDDDYVCASRVYTRHHKTALATSDFYFDHSLSLFSLFLFTQFFVSLREEASRGCLQEVVAN